jgi:anti-sigma-K factor RskA
MMEERLEEQAALYALGALPAEEQPAFESELRQNAELQKLVAELRNATEALAGTAPLVIPPPALREKILAQIESSEKIVPLPVPREAAKPAFAWFPWAMAAGFAIICGLLVARENSLNARLAELNTLAASLQSETNDLRQTIVALRETNRLDNLRIAMLGSLLAEEPKAVAVSLWDEENQKGVFIVQNLKPLARDRDYQLWVVDPQYPNPVDAGVFQVDEQGKVRLQFKTRQPIKSADKFAVTEEVKGGVSVSKGPVILVSN